MATATTRRQAIHSNLRYLSENGSAAQANQGVTLHPIDSEPNAANRARHDRTHGYLEGLQIYYRCNSPDHYVELFPAHDVTVAAATDALW